MSALSFLAFITLPYVIIYRLFNYRRLPKGREFILWEGYVLPWRIRRRVRNVFDDHCKQLLEFFPKKIDDSSDA